MQDKQKVTLYLSPDLHRQLKISSAVNDEPMSALAEKAIHFYLAHPDSVENVAVHGHTHQVYDCPACRTPVVLRSGELSHLEARSSMTSDSLMVESASRIGNPGLDEELLVPC